MRSMLGYATSVALFAINPIAAAAEPPPPTKGPVLSGAKIRVTEADGSHEDYDEKTGDTYWGEFSPLHDTLNLDTKPYITLLIEVKGANPSSASADEPARQIALAMATQMLAQKPAAK